MENITTTQPRWSISEFVSNLPRLLPLLEDVAGPLLPSHQRVAMVLELVRIEESVAERAAWTGRPSCSRKALARAFLAKAILNVPTTKDLVERLVLDVRLRRVVGFFFSVPSESTFSRGFEELALAGVLDKAHESAVRGALGQEIVHHASVDATSIPGREKGARKTAKPETPKTRGRKKGWTKAGWTKPLSPQERQLLQTPEEAMGALPRVCDHGKKRGPKGYLLHWRGYKAHASVGDDGIPLAFLTTSASVHDSLGAIPLVRMAARRVGATFYVLMDKGYAGKTLKELVRETGAVPIVPPKGEKGPEMEAHRKRRYRNRTAAERFFADLKDNHGGDFLFVKGGEKVHAHLMMGVLAIFGLRILQQ